MPKAPEPAVVRRAVLRWYSHNGRAFPWRETRDPYRTLVAEIMLQQTQAHRVAAYLPKFLATFPDPRALSRASRSDVLRAWRGLGYNNRAVRLHAAARELVSSHRGRFPSTPEALQRLPGIGKYTAHALSCFAHGQRVPVVDVNIRRVLSRVFRRMETTAALLSERQSWELAAEVLPAKPYQWNQALMDFGAMVCSARAPKCLDCPVSSLCSSARFMRKSPPTRTPVKGAMEPSHRGVPRRVWRGRVVEALRGAGKRTIGDLTRSVKPEGVPGSAKWMEEIVERLRSDGVVEVRKLGRSLSVSLAS